MKKKEYFDKLRQRVDQKLKLLFIRVDFQSDIKTLRSKWNIPQDGINEEEKNQEWQRWLDKKTDLYVKINWPKAKETMKQLLSQGKLIERDDEQKRFNASVPLNAFHYDIWNLLHKYKLPAHWYNSLKRYLLFNDPNNLWIPVGNVTMEITWDDKTKHRRLALIIYADTTQDDIKSIWSQVMAEQDRLQDKSGDKFQPRPNLDIDKRIHEFWEAGIKPQEKIAEKIREEFNKPYFVYTDVSNALKRYKKRFG